MTKAGEKRKEIQQMTGLQLLARYRQCVGASAIKLFSGEEVPLDLKVEIGILEDETIRRVGKKTTFVL